MVMFKSGPVTIVLMSAAVLVVASTLPAFAQSGTRNYPPRGPSQRVVPQRVQNQAPLGLEGFSPVAVRDAKRWVKGSPAITVVHDGRMYRFASDKEKRAFLANPAVYVPVLNGDCVISHAKMGRRVAGNIRHGMFHNGRLFLFANDRAKQMFAASPTAYENVDLAFGGICPVCRVDMRQTVPGKVEFTAQYDGIRYLFPGGDMRTIFLANPAKYKVGAADAVRPAAGSGVRQPAAYPRTRRPSGGSGSR